MEEEYNIIQATEEYRERIAEFLRQTYYRYEPLNMAFEAPPNRPTGAMRSLQFLKEGTSLIAITKSGLIIGVAINGASRKVMDIHDSSTRTLEAFHESYTKISNFIDKVEKNMDLWKITGAESSLCLHILGVDPIAGGRGIGKKLMELSIDMAKSKGFPFFWTMCSSHYSARICRTLGMECVYRLPYKDNKNEEGILEFLPPAPHAEFTIFLQKFD